MSVRFLTFFVAVAFGATACTTRETDDQRRRLLESWGQDVLLANYAELEANAAELELRAQTFCEGPTEEGLSSAQEAWWAARGSWKRTEVFAIGPYSDTPWRLGPKIDFWPVRPASVETVLASSTPLTPEAVELLGAAAKGLPAIEYVLYPDAPDRVEPFVTEPRRCEYLLGVSAELSRRATDIRRAWDPEYDDYLGELVEAGRRSQKFSSLHAALGEVVNRMWMMVEKIRAEKLGKPLGTSAGGVPQPVLAESQFSGRSIEDIRDNLRGIEAMFFGDASTGALGLNGYLAAKGRHFDNRMRAALDACDQALLAIDVPLTEAIVSEPDQVIAAIDRAGELQRLIQVDVINALSLSVSFNDSDGD